MQAESGAVRSRLRTRRLTTVLVGLLLGAVGTPAGVGTAATGGPEDRIGEYETVAATFRFTIDTERKAIVPVQTSATHQVVTAGGKVVRSEPMKVSARPATAAEAQGEYTCVHRGGGDRALVIYQPMTLFFQSRSIYTQYIVHPYMVPNARQITSGGRTYWTRQLELCTVGGGHLTNGWHQTLNGSTVTLVSPVNRLIGSMWGTEVVNGAVSSTLGVQAGTDPLKVTGSVSVQQQDNHSGNLGPNEVIDAMTDPPLGGRSTTG